MSLSFELQPLKGRRWQLKQRSVTFHRRGPSYWHVSAAMPAAHDLRQAGFPLYSDVHGSLPNIVETVAAILECPAEYCYCNGYYPVGNTGFNLFRKGNRWMVIYRGHQYSDIDHALRFKTWSTRQAALNALKQAFNNR